MPGAEFCDKYIPQQFVPSSARIKLDSEPTRKNKKKNYKKSKKNYESESESGNQNRKPVDNLDEYEEDDDDLEKDYEPEDAYDVKEDHSKRLKPAYNLTNDAQAEPEVTRNSQVNIMKLK